MDSFIPSQFPTPDHRERVTAKPSVPVGNRNYRYFGTRKRKRDTYYENMDELSKSELSRVYHTMMDKIHFRLAALSKEYNGIDDVIRDFQKGKITDDEMMLAFDVFDNDYSYILYLMDKVEEICGENNLPCPTEFDSIREDITVKNERVREILRMF